MFANGCFWYMGINSAPKPKPMMAMLIGFLLMGGKM
jgi:hypothetical protein